jgi:hypothetical protein
MWAYYTSLSGSLSGSSFSLSLSASSSRLSQLGVGANGFNRDSGATLFASYLDSGVSRSVSIPLDTRAAGADCVFNTAAFPQLNCNTSLPLNVTVQQLPGTCPQTATNIRTVCTTDDVDSPPVCATQTYGVCDTQAPTINGNFDHDSGVWFCHPRARCHCD